MAVRSDVIPNRRGERSREAVLDAAERVMAERGYEAATVARLVEEAGVPVRLARCEGLIHGFFRMPGTIPRANAVLDDAAAALREAFAAVPA